MHRLRAAGQHLLQHHAGAHRGSQAALDRAVEMRFICGSPGAAVPGRLKK
jgi:hypothetical protein